ncbi:MAG: FCSD flavin-binding domain-containing protein, partial [Gammaproteobacteria bacterium]|nr:FCSD flavin-binding domain-containing protein [Gammaproteobacteria bacterium]
EAVSSGVTPADATAEQFRRDVAYAHSWFRNITHDIFG